MKKWGRKETRGWKEKTSILFKTNRPTWPKIKWKIKTECHGVDSIYNNAETLWGHT
jgi:hypothetical protein